MAPQPRPSSATCDLARTSVLSESEATWRYSRSSLISHGCIVCWSSPGLARTHPCCLAPPRPPPRPPHGPPHGRSPHGAPLGTTPPGTCFESQLTRATPSLWPIRSSSGSPSSPCSSLWSPGLTSSPRGSRSGVRRSGNGGGNGPWDVGKRTVALLCAWWSAGAPLDLWHAPWDVGTPRGSRRNPRAGQPAEPSSRAAGGGPNIPLNHGNRGAAGAPARVPEGTTLTRSIL